MLVSLTSVGMVSRGNYSTRGTGPGGIGTRGGSMRLGGLDSTAASFITTEFSSSLLSCKAGRRINGGGVPASREVWTRRRGSSTESSSSGMRCCSSGRGTEYEGLVILQYANVCSSSGVWHCVLRKAIEHRAWEVPAEAMNTGVLDLGQMGIVRLNLHWFQCRTID